MIDGFVDPFAVGDYLPDGESDGQVSILAEQIPVKFVFHDKMIVTRFFRLWDHVAVTLTV